MLLYACFGHSIRCGGLIGIGRLAGCRFAADAGIFYRTYALRVFYQRAGKQGRMTISRQIRINADGLVRLKYRYGHVAKYKL